MVAECGLPTMTGRYMIAEDVDDIIVSVGDFYKKGDMIPCSAPEREKEGLSPAEKLLKDIQAAKKAEEDGFYEEIIEGEIMRLRRVVAWADVYMPCLDC